MPTARASPTSRMTARVRAGRHLSRISGLASGITFAVGSAGLLPALLPGVVVFTVVFVVLRATMTAPIGWSTRRAQHRGAVRHGFKQVSGLLDVIEGGRQSLSGSPSGPLVG